ncbi:hypothetical protein Syn7502_01004 [Synechococcus sp. PCC 7502]|uniref:sirohydrochlorin chelatase n=1 Tax=Synechococcus sp. PCC 7502 TaxID=1173263 RepID=UPI00029FCB6D|nr:sirohydrochlorin chelatase [Synechococcus sp. PCC 7502]AFY73119.1 hypothetical protein Syn7502_01004 [Synechococcus sp. PCC 7502]
MPRISYFLVTHGSRNPSAAEFLHNLINLAKAKSENLVGGGLLEGHELTLSQQLVNFANSAKSQVCDQILVIPIFLLAGVHVCEDLPKEVKIAQETYGSQLEIKIANHFGTYPIIPSLLKSKFPKKSTARILLAHGSRRPETRQYLEKLAQALESIPAYWSIAPSLQTQIEALVSQGHSNITVLPYFLSSGGIMEAIATITSNYEIPIQLLELPFAPQAIVEIVINHIEFYENHQVQPRRIAR